MPIYIIRAGNTDKVKIGWAVDPEKRRLAMQSGNHLALRIIRLIECNRKAEKRLQRHFRLHCIRDEWFTLVPEMLTITVEELVMHPTPEPTMSAELRARIARSMRKSWERGSLRRTFDSQSRNSASEDAA